MSGGDTRVGAVYAATCSASPGAGDYCASYNCGPCAEGEGDCDPGQCQSGLECVEEGATDRCRPAECTLATLGAGDYCASYKCGPCAEGEGDCDPGQCGAGLECVEEGATDRCRSTDDGCALATPGAGDYCASYKCGPCVEGEGDCDPGQCGAGLECVEEGATDRCRPTDGECTLATPGAGDYCSSARCGPCAEGEGDCDPGQCGAGLECVEEGSIDRCRAAGSGTSNLQVKVDGVWKGICCNGDIPEVSDGGCFWTEYDRTLTDEAAGLKLDCPEGDPRDCDCDGSGERLHGVGGGHVDRSLLLPDGGPVYPDYTMETCVFVKSSGELATRSPDSGCPSFRLK